MWIPRRSSAVLLAALLISGAAKAATLTVLTPASAAPGATALATQFTKATGIAVTVAGGSRDRIFAALKVGGPADVVLLPTNDFAELPAVTGMTPLGHIAVGVGVKAGARVPDVSTPEKFRSLLQAANGVAYADPAAGTSAGKVIDRMLSGPDFARVKRVPVQGLAVTALASDKADIALQMLPELMENKEVALAGPVPEVYGASVDFAAGIAAVSNDAVQAQAFISFVTAPAAVPVWKAHGVTLLGTIP
ncbi:MAG: substrate-binding domain-containing protein [Alphaproteobacteria bacterium]|nr:substrate-binding domain-containing protein [Alphaproteobacteria bacterium]